MHSSSDGGTRSTEHLATLNAYYDAEQRYVAAGGAEADADFGEMAAHLHPDVVVRQGPTVPYSGDWHGVDGLKKFFATFTDTWSQLELSDIRYFDGAAGLAVHMRMQATAAATGKNLDTVVGHFLRFEDGLIRELVVLYQDPVQVSEVTRT